MHKMLFLSSFNIVELQTAVHVNFILSDNAVKRVCVQLVLD